MESTPHPGAFGALSEPYCRYGRAAIAVLPIPYDGTSTWMKGADRGPQALLDASSHMELYDLETHTQVFRSGIVTMPPVRCPADPQEMVSEVQTRAAQLLQDGKFVVGVGGEHSVSIGLVQAMAQRFTDLSVLHLDAHADTREEYEGSRYNHACVMSRIGEVCPYVQAGVRSMAASERSRYRPDRTFFARDILRHPAVAHEIVAGLTSQVYLSIDLDVFDPSIMPSTGTPEPGGLDWHTVMDLLEPVIQQREVVGMDLTELLPNSQNRAPDFLAAKLVYRILSMVFAKNEE